MEKDWSARFESPRPLLRRGCLTLIAIPLAIISVLWAMMELQIGFYDSMGNYRPPASIAQLAGVLLIAFAPSVVPAILIFVDWKKPRQG